MTVLEGPVEEERRRGRERLMMIEDVRRGGYKATKEEA